MKKNKHDRKYIIFGGDGINPLGIVRSLGEVGIESDIIRFRESAHLATIETSKYVRNAYYGDTNEELLTILLSHYGDEELKPVVFFTDEGNEAFFDAHYNKLKDKFICYNADIENGINNLLSKEVQCQLAAQCGIRVPIYEVLDKSVLPSKVPYPVITKTLTSNDGGWKKDMIICNNEEELKVAYSKIQAKKIMVEEYINGTNEVDLKGFSINGGEQIYFTSLKKWHYKDVQHKWLMYFEPCYNEDLKRKLSSLIRKANYSGIFDAEFMQDINGELFFLEVNWRTGMYNYNHTYEGVNLPFLWAKSMIDNNIDNNSIHQCEESYSAIDEISSFSDVLRHPKLFIKWIKAIRKADILFYYNKQDKKPCIIAWKRFLMRKVAKFFNGKNNKRLTSA